MKRQQTRTPKARSSKKQAIEKSEPSFFDLLPRDMNNVIIDYLINDTSEKKPRDAVRVFSHLARVNKQFNNLINNPEHKKNPLHSDNLIEKLSENYGCSHESVATFLHTQGSLIRLKLQKKLVPLFNWKSNRAIRRKLKRLIKEDINLNFTYNHYGVQTTPLMRAINSRTTLFDLLIKKGADINTSNAHGLTVLKILLEPTINIDKLTVFLSQEKLDLNQQDKRGRTPLLHMLINEKRRRMGPSATFITALKTLLARPVDPELGTKLGFTPLLAAQYYYSHKPEVANLILDAIARKKAKQITQ